MENKHGKTDGHQNGLQNCLSNFHGIFFFFFLERTIPSLPLLRIWHQIDANIENRNWGRKKFTIKLTRNCFGTVERLNDWFVRFYSAAASYSIIFFCFIYFGPFFYVLSDFFVSHFWSTIILTMKRKYSPNSFFCFSWKFIFDVKIDGRKTDQHSRDAKVWRKWKSF